MDQIFHSAKIAEKNTLDLIACPELLGRIPRFT